MIEELRKAFGARLRALRKQHHWTLKELAAQLNVLPPQLNKYECGINWPPADKILDIAAIFQVSIDYLLQGSASDALPIHNHRLVERFRALQSFPKDDQDTVIKLIDAMIIKQRVQGALSSLNPLPPQRNQVNQVNSMVSDDQASAPSSPENFKNLKTPKPTPASKAKAKAAEKRNTKKSAANPAKSSRNRSRSAS